MDTNSLEGRWKQVRGQVLAEWGDLTKDDAKLIEGNREKLVGIIQAKYGDTKDAIERKLDHMMHSTAKASKKDLKKIEKSLKKARSDAKKAEKAKKNAKKAEKDAVKSRKKAEKAMKKAQEAQKEAES